MMRLLAWAVTALALSGCHPGPDMPQAMRTRAPGHIAAGGGTSGQVLAAAASSGAAEAATTTPAPSGTPGIPKGAEGNTGGTSPGGALGEPGIGASAPPMPVRSEKSGTAPPSEDVKTGEQTSPRMLQPSAPDKAGH